MKKIKANVAKLQLNKEKIGFLTNEEAGKIIGASVPYANCTAPWPFEKVTYSCFSYCDGTPNPGNTGCDDCTVCPRPW